MSKREHTRTLEPLGKAMFGDNDQQQYGDTELPADWNIDLLDNWQWDIDLPTDWDIELPDWDVELPDWDIELPENWS